MSKRSTLVLTRPRDASERIARDVEARVGPVPILISPVLEIVGVGADVDLSAYHGIILTSQNAPPFLPSLAGMPAFVVGARTAEASGADVRLVAKDADDLVARIDAAAPLLHAHGRETRGDVAERLSLSGIETHSLVVYDQEPRALTQEAKAAIEGEAKVILPLWSPRSAILVAQGLKTLSPQLHAIALSSAVAMAWQKATGGVCDICENPEGDDMLARIVAAFGAEVA